MMQIDAARAEQHSPLDMLATDYLINRPLFPSIDFCRRAAGLTASDEVVARRVGVAISVVRGWREIGRRAESRYR